MKALLIYPRYKWPEIGQMQEPLGILYIASLLRQNGLEVRFLDFTFEQTLDRLKEAVNWADAVGMSFSSVLFSRAVHILEKIKAQRPELLVIAGGPHPTADPEGTLKSGFDYLVIGEGEQSGLELFQALSNGKDGKNLDGVWTRSGDEIIKTPLRSFIPDLDRIPFPARDLFDYQTYLKSGMSQIGICLARGCPFQCRFCKPMQDLIFGRKLRKRSPASVAEEIEWAEELTGHSFFLFRDDNLSSLGLPWFREFRTELEKRRLKIKFSGQTRVNNLSEELVREMKDLGLVGLAFGVESGSQKIIDYYNKNFKVEDSVAAFETCHRLGIGTHCFIILGAPPETRDDLQLTIDLVKKIHPESITISRLTPAPGTYLHAETIQQGLLKEVSWEEWDFYKNQSPLKLAHLAEADLMKAENELRAMVAGSVLYPRQEIVSCAQIINQ